MALQIAFETFSFFLLWNDRFITVRSTAQSSCHVDDILSFMHNMSLYDDAHMKQWLTAEIQKSPDKQLIDPSWGMNQHPLHRGTLFPPLSTVASGVVYYVIIVCF